MQLTQSSCSDEVVLACLCSVGARAVLEAQTTSSTAAKGKGGGTPGKPGGDSGQICQAETRQGIEYIGHGRRHGTTITASSITIKTKDGDRTFDIDANTKVQDHTTGAGKASKTPITVGDAISVKDKVTVVYRDAGASAHAATIRVVSKKSRV